MLVEMETKQESPRLFSDEEFLSTIDRPTAFFAVWRCIPATLAKSSIPKGIKPTTVNYWQLKLKFFMTSYNDPGCAVKVY